MKISTIIPCYNGTKFISTFIEGLNRLIKPEEVQIEFIFVDNGSTDNSFELLQKCIQEFNIDMAIIFSYTDKQGSYAARNFGVSQSTGDVFVFVDIDCIIDENYFVKLWENKNVLLSSSLIAGNVKLFTNEPATVYERYDYLFGFNMHNYIKDRTGVTANLVIPSSVFNDSLGFDEVESGGDRNFCKRILENKNVNFFFFEDMIVFHPCRSTYSELITKSKRIARGLVSYYSGLSSSEKFKKVVLLSVSCFIQRHQIKMIGKNRKYFLDLSYYNVVVLICIIFWFGFVSRFFVLRGMFRF